MKFISREWNKFWFEGEDTSPLEILRVGIGSVVFFHYLSLIGHLEDFYGSHGVVRPETAHAYYEALIPSVLRFIPSSTGLFSFYFILLISTALFVANYKPNLTKWLVWYGHYCFIKQNPFIVGGADRVVHSILFLLALAPLGKQRLIFSSWASACLRLIQIQICIVYFYAGTRKLEYSSWWSGDALWIAMVDPQYTSGWAAFFAHHYWLINVGCYLTLLFEIGYPFLITNSKVRPYLMMTALVFHFAISFVMGLFYFGFAMIFANLAFFDRNMKRKVSSLMRRIFLSEEPDVVPASVGHESLP